MRNLKGEVHMANKKQLTEEEEFIQETFEKSFEIFMDLSLIRHRYNDDPATGPAVTALLAKFILDTIPFEERKEYRDHMVDHLDNLIKNGK